MYILVNQDVGMGKGKIAGQVGHAVNILTYRMCKQNNKLIDEYMQGAIKKIVLKCPQSKLEELEMLRPKLSEELRCLLLVHLMK